MIFFIISLLVLKLKPRDYLLLCPSRCDKVAEKAVCRSVFLTIWPSDCFFGDFSICNPVPILCLATKKEVNETYVTFTFREDKFLRKDIHASKHT